jgi:hypothetical protein
MATHDFDSSEEWGKKFPGSIGRLLQPASGTAAYDSQIEENRHHNSDHPRASKPA